jgi:hypothetical protein
MTSRHLPAQSLRATVIVVALALVAGCGRRPTDEQLIDRFRRERATFDTLRHMFFAATLGRVGPTFTRPVNFFCGGPPPVGPALTPQRLVKDQSLFRRLGLGAGIEGYDEKAAVSSMRLPLA